MIIDDKFRIQLNPYTQGCGLRLPGSGSNLREEPDCQAKPWIRTRARKKTRIRAPKSGIKIINSDPQPWPDWTIRKQGTPYWEIHLITYHRRRFMYFYLQDLL